MIGPRAYEEMFLTKHPKMKDLVLEHEGQRYFYSYDWEILEMFDSMIEFEVWCMEDMKERGGMYADSIEVIE